MSDSLNADFRRPARVDTAAVAWQASPSPSVWRKRLDLVDGEFSRVTSVVRYDANSAFHAHGHPQGEEIMVPDGTFSDEHGDRSEEHTSELQSLMSTHYALFCLKQ